MIKFLKRVIISIIILSCAVISLLTGGRIFKTFAGAKNYMNCTEEQLNNRFLSVEFEEISPLAMNYYDRSCYVGKTYDGRMVLVLKDTADDEGLTPHTLLKGILIVIAAVFFKIKIRLSKER